MEECVSSMVSKLGEKAWSISVVPKTLRTWKEEAYMPQVVSIGPLHKGTNTDLLPMEEIKWHCMKHLFHRSGQGEEKCLRDCLEAMFNLDETVRASYNVDEVKLNSNDFVKIIVLDGCFLLELLISVSPQLNDLIKCSLDYPSPGLEVIQREKVLSDLTMLENQIPLFILQELSATLFPTYFTKDDNSIRLIQEHALSMLGYSTPSPQLKAFHFVDLVHSFLDKEKDQPSHKATNDSKISVGSGNDNKVSRGKSLKQQSCATKLKASGVTIKPSEAKKKATNMAEMSRFDLKVRFNDGKLEIPQLHVTETTEAKWKNFIAWEINKLTVEKQRSKEAKIRCQFISYAWFIQGLICCVEDVKLLRNRKVILVEEVESAEGKKKRMSDEALMNLFRNITKGLPDAEIEMDPWFADVIQKLNLYTTTVHHKIRVFWHGFRCRLWNSWYVWRNLILLMTKFDLPTMLIAVAGLYLSIIQTFFTVGDHSKK